MRNTISKENARAIRDLEIKKIDWTLKKKRMNWILQQQRKLTEMLATTQNADELRKIFQTFWNLQDEYTNIINNSIC